MGYELTMLVIKSYHKNKLGQAVGYCKVDASVELYKCGSGPIDAVLAHEIKDKDLKAAVEELNAAYDLAYGLDGEFTEYAKGLDKKEQDKVARAPFKLSKALEKKLPHVFYSNWNKEDYEDAYGSLLIQTSVAEAEKAIAAQNLESIARGDNYYHYDVALSVLKHYRDDKNAAVIFYGH